MFNFYSMSRKYSRERWLRMTEEYWQPLLTRSPKFWNLYTFSLDPYYNSHIERDGGQSDMN
jgi:hypothetical protein